MMVNSTELALPENEEGAGGKERKRSLWLWLGRRRAELPGHFVALTTSHTLVINSKLPLSFSFMKYPSLSQIKLTDDV